VLVENDERTRKLFASFIEAAGDFRDQRAPLQNGEQMLAATR